MNIILLQDLEKVGSKYDVVTVKPGYAQNFLIPKKMAIVANATNLQKLDEHKQREAAKEAQVVEEFKALKTQIEALTLSIGAKAGTSGKIFGSVTSVQIAQALEERGIEVDRRLIEMPEEVKELGDYEATVAFHRDVAAKVKFSVVAD